MEVKSYDLGTVRPQLGQALQPHVECPLRDLPVQAGGQGFPARPQRLPQMISRRPGQGSQPSWCLGHGELDSQAPHGPACIL